MIKTNSCIEWRELVSTLQYNPCTGDFIWIVRRSRVFIGMKAGNATYKGYWVICIRGRDYKAHVLAWFYMTKQWPDDLIDHINRIRDDNRWLNLRQASKGQNQVNTHRYGESRCIMTRKNNKEVSKFRVRIRHRIHGKDLGTYNTFEEAKTVYDTAAKQLYGEFYENNS